MQHALEEEKIMELKLLATETFRKAEAAAKIEGSIAPTTVAMNVTIDKVLEFLFGNDEDTAEIPTETATGSTKASEEDKDVSTESKSNTSDPGANKEPAV